MSIVRRYQTPEGWREAVYSQCEAYRYGLTVSWDTSRPKLAFVMLNPSKATELANDPTIERCERRAKHLGYGAMRIANVFALRETSPQALKQALEPEGDGNEAHVLDAAAWADAVLAAWGVHGAHRGFGPRYEAALKQTKTELFHLGLTKEGHPRHPLYVPYSVAPKPWK